MSLKFFLCEESQRMYHNAVVNSVVNIYLISLPDTATSVPNADKGNIAWNIFLHTMGSKDQQKVAQIIPLLVKSLPFSSFFIINFEYFTLPHRFQVDSTGLHMDSWSPHGVHVDFHWQRAQPNIFQSPPGVYMDSRWTPDGWHGLDGVHSTPPT